jgi:predicted alpha/beta hydrolase
VGASEGLEAEISLEPFTVPVSGPQVDQPRAVIVLLPALGVPADRYRAFGDALAADGIAALMAELPGTGASRPRPSRIADYGYRDLAARYLPALVGLARKLVPAVPVIVAGHSIGGQIAVLAARHGYLQVDGLLTLAAGHIHFRRWSGGAALKVYGAAIAATTLSKLLGHLPGQHVGFGGPQARTLMCEWSRVIRSGSFPDVGGQPPAIPAAPALSIAYEGDSLAPLRSVTGLAELAGGDVLMLPAPGGRHPHSGWLREPAETVAAIGDWLDGRQGAASE